MEKDIANRVPSTGAGCHIGSDRKRSVDDPHSSVGNQGGVSQKSWQRGHSHSSGILGVKR
jgi:hypothetical protein